MLPLGCNPKPRVGCIRFAVKALLPVLLCAWDKWVGRTKKTQSRTIQFVTIAWVGVIPGEGQITVLLVICKPGL